MDENDPIIIEYISRLKALSGLREAPEEYISPEDAEEMDADKDAERFDREARMEKLIVQAFRRCGLPIETDFDGSANGVHYDEESREVRVTLDDFEAPLSKLALLMQSGLAADFQIAGLGDNITVTFTLDAGMDGAL